jgi:hypothetical protein
MHHFDVPSSRLADLSDGDFRELVARLCEAERERQGGHRNEVHWGGSQTTPDGGLDVVVEAIGPFIPMGALHRRHVGIQVKKEDLRGAKISSEMRPNGRVRTLLADLAANAGSYLIVSASANCAKGTMIAERESAMRQAIADDPNADRLHVGYMDQNAVARWVSAHPSVAAWLRERLDLPTLRGWKSYGRWSSTPHGHDDELICGDGLVFRFPDGTEVRNMPDALNAMRTLVKDGRKALRIAGFSGVGKSRIAQALFEDWPVESPLSRSFALYADFGDDPDPSPKEMLRQLVESGKPHVLIVDNCPPEAHTALAEELSRKSGSVRLITIEYDVQLDRPTETDVVRIDTEGSEILRSLLRRRHPSLSDVDALRLADLAQGNARLGLALAAAMPMTGSLSSFEDTQLFNRLFWQRGKIDPLLEESAGVLSLVYSFDVEGVEKPDELAILAQLINVPRNSLFRQVAVLQKRGLAQARGRWRAILPHALANRLAKETLASVPRTDLLDAFASSKRLRRSFARRLSYLHDADEAIRIVEDWTKDGGPLAGAAASLDLLDIVGHLVPHHTLCIVDALISAGSPRSWDSFRADPVTRVLMRIARDEAFFAPVCDRLVVIIRAFPEAKKNVENALAALFQLRLSGTKAKTQVRQAVAKAHLTHPDETVQKIGVEMVRSALIIEHFSSHGFLHDDALPEPYGWWPKNDEAMEWYASWYDLAVGSALNGHPYIRVMLRAVLASRAGGIWRRVPSLRPAVVAGMKRLHEAKEFHEGQAALIALISLSRRRREAFPQEDVEALTELITAMEPSDLPGKVRQELARAAKHDLDYDHDDHARARAEKESRLVDIGRELGVDIDTLKKVAPELLSSPGTIYHIGHGIAQGAHDWKAVWEILCEEYSGLGDAAKQPGILATFLHEIDPKDPIVADKLRRDALTLSGVRKIFGMLLPIGEMSQAQLEEVLRLAGDPSCEPFYLSRLLWERDRSLPDDFKASLLRVLSARPDGLTCAMNALNHLAMDDEGIAWSDSLADAATGAVISLVETGETNTNREYEVARVARRCLEGGDGTRAKAILAAVANRSNRRRLYRPDFHQVLGVIAELHSAEFLDWMTTEPQFEAFLDLHDGYEPSPMCQIPPEKLVAWCGDDPERWEKVSATLPPFAFNQSNMEEVPQMTETARVFFSSAPVSETVIRAFIERVSPMSWSGSRATVMERRLTALLQLRDDCDEQVQAIIDQAAVAISADIEAERAREAVRDREREQRFEH